jgi:TolB-like protein/Tfp pilus assembly protein PilF
MIGTTISHYHIVGALGAGGMGVVYRAHDQRLERDVALKMLPEGALAGEEARERLRREALSLSRINHPYIAAVYDLDRDDGTDFLVMELVAGSTLAEQLASGPLPEPTILTLGAQIAEALDAAHAQGVVHRDLKPLNIVVTPRGHAKVLDFGVAALYRVTRGGPSGAPPVVGGTLAYTAPDQLLGARPDPRADLYALGVVLYEMATARLPFRADLPSAVMYEILNTEPPPPRQFRRDLSSRLEDVIMKCLEKDPEYRYQSARELVVDLKRIEAGAGAAGTAAARPPAVTSLAVLPLANLSGDPEQEFFADGMTDALIADLAQIGGLRVISRTSAMRYKGSGKPLPEIARELNVDAVVEGTVLRAGDRVRITAQLIDAVTDRHRWARSYQRDLSDVLALQGEVARAIAQEIRLELTPRQRARLVGARAIAPAAYETYLRGRHFWNQRAEVDVRKGISLFERAIEIDPNHALAYSGIADSYNILGDIGAMHWDEAFAHAKEAAGRALALDPDLAEAHTSMAFAWFFWMWDWNRAEETFRHALRLNPGYATGHQWFAEFLASQGRFDEATREAQHAADLDPLSLVIGTTHADVLYFGRRYEDSIETLHRTLEIGPNFVAAHTDLGRAATQLQRFDEAIAEFRIAADLQGIDPDHAPGLGYAYAAAGRRDDALRVIGELEARRAERPISSHAIAAIHLALGDEATALDTLERAYRERDRALVWLKVHPRLDPLRGHPRFAALVREMKFAG